MMREVDGGYQLDPVATAVVYAQTAIEEVPSSLIDDLLAEIEDEVDLRRRATTRRRVLTGLAPIGPRRMADRVEVGAERMNAARTPGRAAARGGTWSSRGPSGIASPQEVTMSDESWSAPAVLGLVPSFHLDPSLGRPAAREPRRSLVVGRRDLAPARGARRLSVRFA